MTTFNKLFAVTIGALILFGFVLPYLVSARSNELTMLGIVIIIGLGYKLGQIAARNLGDK